MTARQHTQQTQGTTSHHAPFRTAREALQMWRKHWDSRRRRDEKPPTKPPTGPGIIVMPTTELPEGFDITAVAPSGPPAPELCPHCGKTRASG